MIKFRKRLQKWQRNHPRINDLLPYIIGTALGFLINMFTNDVAENSKTATWRWVDSIWIWISIGVFLLGVAYYLLFDSYKVTSLEEEPADEFHRATTAKLKHLKTTRAPYEEICEVMEKHVQVLVKLKQGGVRK